MVKKNKGLDYINFALSFGLTLAITTYILYLGGSWLDKWLGTTPIFMMLGIILSIVTVFRQLINEVKDMEKEKAEETVEKPQEEKLQEEMKKEDQEENDLEEEIEPKE
jgi:uncharacterized protein YlxW (UPF0749 family)